MNARRLALALGVAILVFTAGLVLGAYWGGIYALYVDSVPRGSIAAGQIGALKAGKPDGVIMMLESEVDTSLAYFSRLSESPIYPLFRSGLLYVDADYLERTIRRPASHRSAVPSPYGANLFDTVPADKKGQEAEYREMAKALHEHHERIKSVVKRYGGQ